MGGRRMACNAEGLRMWHAVQILDMFDIKGNFGARKEADAPVDGEPVTHRAQPIVNYSRRCTPRPRHADPDEQMLC